MIFSVVLPTYNRLVSLRQSLESVLKQDFNDYEVIVVDDGSTDGTADFLSSVSDPRLRFCTQANAGPALARNRGASMAAGEILAFTDDDCIVPPMWLSCLWAGFQDVDVAIVGGAVRNGVTENLFSVTSQEMTNHFVEFLNSGGSSSGFLTSNNIAYRRAAFETAHGFDPRFRQAGGEERALNHHIISAGGRSRYVNGCIVKHFHHMTLSGFLRQHHNYGRGAYLLQYVMTSEAPFTPIPPYAYAAMIRRWFGEGLAGGLAKTGLFVLAETSALVGFGLEAFSPHRRRGVPA